ncbi:MAG TPA: hypothetical protein VL354_12440 [Spirochaetia bacterium]|nr:hypothetical protein [Spirochaetia bacterium]
MSDAGIALQFGAGNIGRGFMGQLFWEAGFHTVQVDSNPLLVSLMNSRRRYTLTLLDAYSRQATDLMIDNIEGASTEEGDRIAGCFARARVVGTAVGPKNLPAIAPLIASGIRERRRRGGAALDIYLCENVLDAAHLLKTQTFSFLDPGLQSWAEGAIGFVGTSVARMVPPRSERYGGGDPLSVVADAYHKLPYDGSAARAAPLPCQGTFAVSNFRAEVERKLYTHNLGHAALGYLGYLRGFRYVHEPLDDEFSSAVFEGALDETSQALLATYPADLDPAEHRETRKDVRIRFGNPLLQDTVTRVAREPIRKLGPQDRLIGSINLCRSRGVFPKHICVICGAALLYDDPGDAEALALRALVEHQGVSGALREVTGLEPQSDEAQAVLDAYSSLEEQKRSRGTTPHSGGKS